MKSPEFAYFHRIDGTASSIYLKNGINLSSLFFKELNLVTGLTTPERRVTHQCIGPLEAWEDVISSLGTFYIEDEIDAGYFSIHSVDKNLMDLVAAQFRKSSHFYERINNNHKGHTSSVSIEFW